MKPIFILLTLLTLSAQAVPQDQAVRAIIGEAANQPYKGQVAVANVIRHRGSLQGICGANAGHIRSEPEWVWTNARRAWAESATNDVSRGATHFEAVKIYGRPKWATGMTATITIKDHTFFK